MKRHYVRFDIFDSRGWLCYKHDGVPFHAIFDAHEKMLIDSDGPGGNIGHPSGFEGKRQLRKMIAKTREYLTNEEVNQLIGSLDD